MRVSILAVELAVRMDRAPRLHAHLCENTRRALPAASLQEKWDFYASCAGALRAELGAAERGCWDFFDDDARARKDFEMWKGGMTTREGAREAPSGEADPYRGGVRYLTFTIAMLLVHGSSSERAMAAACEIPDAQLWRRASFARVLDAVRALSFASVYSDVAYLIPRDAGWALTSEDLAQEKFEYLRPILD
ncbi:MAG: hypothetical protein IT374_15020 [Polyangiaceae bacterium]|nr:hypothetical protein [Polyangiaceae bacterium]